MADQAPTTWLLLISCLLTLPISTLQAYYDPYSYPTKNAMMNVIDSCWRSDPEWATNRRALADCAVGFGSAATGGKFGDIYVVTSPLDDPVNPTCGTLRYGAVQDVPLWIVFAKDMVIILENELIVNNFKTIDGRGAKVEITNGPCIVLQHVSHVIIHGIIINKCRPGKPGLVMSSSTQVSHHDGSDGDAISIIASTDIWIDHCSLADSSDGLIDVTHASTAITISNNYFHKHDKVMLLGHDDSFKADKIMRVTVAFNHFASGLHERMPRVRFGYAHVANNLYEEWQVYAIGGSANPTIFSEGNYFIASNNPYAKQVTKRETRKDDWKCWNWRSSRDVFGNGAYFVQSGSGNADPSYSESQSFAVADGSSVPALTYDTGPLSNFGARGKNPVNFFGEREHVNFFLTLICFSCFCFNLLL